MSSRYFSTWGNSDHNLRQNENTISSCLQRFGQHWAIPAERVSEKVWKIEILVLFMGVDREKYEYLIISIIISDPSSDRPALEGTSDIQQDVQDRQQHPMWILPEEDIHLPEG